MANPSHQVVNQCSVCHRMCEETDESHVMCGKCQKPVHVECDVLAIIPSRAEQSNESCVYYCPLCRPKLDDQEISQFSADYDRELLSRNFSALSDEDSRTKEELIDDKTEEECSQLHRIVYREFQSVISQWNESNAIQAESNPKKKQMKITALHKRASQMSHEATKKSSLACPKIEPNKQRPVPSMRVGGDMSLKLSSPQSLMLSTSLGSGLPLADQIKKEIPVECNGVPGIFYFGEQRVKCECSECLEKPDANRIFTATHFEQHSGAGSAKKWKASVRIRPGGVPEVAATDPPLPLGRWFVMRGIDELVTRVPVAGRRRDGSKSAAKSQANYSESGFVDLERSHQSDAKPWDQVRVGGYMKIHVKYAGDRCSVCDADVDYDCDQLISCDKCGITVHQTCYGVHEKLSNDQVWLCNVCRAQGTENAECCLCPIAEGARKPTTIAGLWCHVACMQWIPEVTVVNPMKMEPVSRIERIQKERWELNCCFCKQKMGAKIQCTACYTSYHPLCARIAGMHMEMKDGPQGSNGPLDLITYCPRHALAHPELSGIKLVLDHKEDSDGALFNRQPYPEALAVSIPQPEAGCARAQPLGGWERKSHGSGSGYESVKAFWIPLKPKVDDYGNFVNADGTPIDPTVLPRFRKKRAKFFSQKSHRSKASRIGDRDDGVLQPVALMPLPEAALEQVTVECNGIRGVFYLRCQKVMHQGVLIPAARFETLCGRGDAKKWKSSLWYVNEETGNAEIQMSTWLLKVGLDRKTLLALRDNHAEHEAYESQLLSQVKNVMDEMLKELSTEQDFAEGGTKREPVEENIPTVARTNEDGGKGGSETYAEDSLQRATEAFSDDVLHEVTQSSDQMSFSNPPSVKEDDASEAFACARAATAASPHETTDKDIDVHPGLTDKTTDHSDTDLMEDVRYTDETEPSHHFGPEIVGQNLLVRCSNSAQTRFGRIAQYRAPQQEHYVYYEDGSSEWIDLMAEKASWDAERSFLTIQKETAGSSASHAQIENQGETGGGVKVDLPEEIEVFCKEFRATFLVKEKMILSDQGLKMTPRDFERAAGKGAAKKWKNSIKVKKPDGKGLMTLGEWLIRHGCLPDTEGRIGRSRGLARTGFSQRSRGARAGEPSWLMQKYRRQRHQVGCQCIVCRQSRRRASQCNLTGRIESDDLNRSEKWQPATTLAALRAHGPGIRYGKRAYVRAVPQIVGGVVRHQLHEIPSSKCWTGKDWVKHVQENQGNGGVSLSETAQQEVQCKTEKWKAQLKHCNETQDHRVTFGKSGIHGWGLFALVNHRQDEMIIEYKGEIVTPAVADMREKHYRENEKDCYLFHVNDSFIIDATVKGSIARFINHCCEPCMYCKDIQLNGKNHLCFFARYDIRAGQELTYDYRFKEEVEENKLICNCGAPNCRGFLN